MNILTLLDSLLPQRSSESLELERHTSTVVSYGKFQEAVQKVAKDSESTEQVLSNIKSTLETLRSLKEK